MRQCVGRRDTGALAVAHRAGHTDEGDALDPDVAEFGQTAGRSVGLVEERGDLGAQALDAGQFRA